MGLEDTNEIRPDYEVAVIGAGPSGICAGITLRRAGITDFVIIERASAPGGTWRDNTYPGIGVDVPTFVYEYTFARNPEWSRLFPKGHEIDSYHSRVAHDFGLDPHFRFNTEVVRQIWDDNNHLWRLHTAAGDTVTARFLITAVGPFIDPLRPNIPGLDDFQGKIQMSARWDHSYDHTGKQVAVIGTGASAVQIVPVVASEAGNLTVYQRTPVYCVPKPDFSFPRPLGRVVRTPIVNRVLGGSVLFGVDAGMGLFHKLPAGVMHKVMGGLDALAKGLYGGYLRAVVQDQAVAKALTPAQGIACKRPTISNSYVQSYNRDNVDLVTTAIDRITPTGIRTVDGAERQLDMIVLATGHRVYSDPEYYTPGTIVGRNGFDLGEFYQAEGLQAYESMTVPGLPNRWMLVGPYSWAHTLHGMAEVLSNHIVEVVTNAKRDGVTLVEVRQEVHAAYHAKMVQREKILVWYMNEKNEGVSTYYMNSQYRVPALRLSSWSALLLRRRLNGVMSDYHTERHNESVELKPELAVGA